ncbi:hypothetical protein N8559_09010 [Gammaproteobacteria bacterium]|nr:hypothetical protein [Gammaproteobacteria bacterium]
MSVSIETVGVLLTLLYLAFELRANNKIAMSNSHREISKQLSEWYSLLKNLETSLILARGSLDFSSLSPEEKLEFDTVRHHHFHICEQIFYMGRGKLIPTSVYDAFMTGTAIFLSSKGTSEWWEDSRIMTYAPEFVAEVEKFRANSKDLPDPMVSFPPFKYALELLGEAEKLKQ